MLSSPYTQLEQDETKQKRTDEFEATVFSLKNTRLMDQSGADPARVHWVHVHPPCVRVTCS